MAGKASGGKVKISGGKGKAPVVFQKGGLHQSLGVPEGQPIPAAKMAAAKAGKYGPKAQKQANFATGMLAAGRKTAAKNRKKGSLWLSMFPRRPRPRGARRTRLTGSPATSTAGAASGCPGRARVTWTATAMMTAPRQGSGTMRIP
jgi:hypothetical protein